MSKSRDIIKIFKEKDLTDRRKSDSEMGKQGYYVYKEKRFRDHKVKDLIKLGGIMRIGFKVMTSNDRYIEVTYRKK